MIKIHIMEQKPRETAFVYRTVFKYDKTLNRWRAAYTGFQFVVLGSNPALHAWTSSGEVSVLSRESMNLRRGTFCKRPHKYIKEWTI